MPICVTGMPGSGVAMVTDILERGGVKIVDRPRRDPDEADGLVAVNEALLAAIGGAWDVPPELPADWDLLSAPAAVRVSAAKVLRELDPEEPWGWADPCVSLTLRFWRRLLPDLKVVACLRNPVEAAESLQASRGISSRLAAHLWSAYYGRLSAAPSGPWRLTTHYESHLFDAAAELRRLLQFLGVEPTNGALESAAEVAQSNRRRHQAPATAVLEAPYADLASRYLELCAEAGPQLHAALGEPLPEADGGALEAIALHRELAESRAAQSAAEKRIEELRRDLAETKKRHARRAQALEQSRAKAEEKEAQLAARHEEELTALRTELEESRQELGRMTARCDDLLRERDELKGVAPAPTGPPRSLPPATAQPASVAQRTWRALPSPAQKLLRPAAERARRRRDAPS
jgi:hypothetical protein